MISTLPFAGSLTDAERRRIERLPRIATMATMPTRAGSFREAFASLRPQVERFFIFLDGFDAVPDALANDPKVTAVLSKDAGDLHAAGRFLCLRHLASPTIVISVDDDIVYPPDYVGGLAKALATMGGRSVVGVLGGAFIPPREDCVRDVYRFHFTAALGRPQLVDELGTGTIAFISSVLDFDPASWPRFDANDLCIAIEAKRRGLPLWCIPRGEGWLRAIAEEQPDSLWMRTKRAPSVRNAMMQALIADPSGDLMAAAPDVASRIDATVHNARRPDLYLQPHSDDVCFSLGGRGVRPGSRMLTIFSLARWIYPNPEARGMTPEAVTAVRLAEDEAFCRACGLVPANLGIASGSMLGWQLTEIERADENRRRFEDALLAELTAGPPPADPDARPWLFCPAGIGHLDHVAVAATVIAHHRRLSALWRIAFYEDLPYAAKPRARRRGLTRFLAAANGLALRRQILPLAPADIARKLARIALYPSQMERRPTDLSDYAPATVPAMPDHEAIWSTETLPDARPSPRLASAVERFVRVAGDRW